jgi:hypothetical protein
MAAEEHVLLVRGFQGTLTRNWALPGARQRTLARDVGEGWCEVLWVWR